MYSLLISLFRLISRVTLLIVLSPLIPIFALMGLYKTPVLGNSELSQKNTKNSSKFDNSQHVGDLIKPEVCINCNSIQIAKLQYGSSPTPTFYSESLGYWVTSAQTCLVSNNGAVWRCLGCSMDYKRDGGIYEIPSDLD